MPAKATGVLVEVWNSSNLLDQLIGSLVVPLPLPLKQDATPAEYPLTTICGACSGPSIEPGLEPVGAWRSKRAGAAAEEGPLRVS